jgi:hypothetical protein
MPLDPCDSKPVCDPDSPAPAPEEAVVTATDAEIVRRAIAEGKHGRLAQLVHADPTHVLVNAERSAVQLINCVGDVVAHFPISADQAQLLSIAQ